MFLFLFPWFQKLFENEKKWENWKWKTLKRFFFFKKNNSFQFLINQTEPLDVFFSLCVSVTLMVILLQVFCNWFIREDGWSRRLFKEKSIADKQEEDFGEWRPWVCGAKISFVCAIYVCPEDARIIIIFFFLCGKFVDISRFFLFCPLVAFSCEFWKDVNFGNLFSPLSKGFSFWCLRFCFMLSPEQMG